MSIVVHSLAKKAVMVLPHLKIGVDSKPMEYESQLPKYSKLHPDFVKDYPDAKEEIASHFPEAFGPVMETTIFVDADHVHDQKTR